jgi:hypothetical protein
VALLVGKTRPDWSACDKDRRISLIYIFISEFIEIVEDVQLQQAFWSLSAVKCYLIISFLARSATKLSHAMAYSEKSNCQFLSPIP